MRLVLRPRDFGKNVRVKSPFLARKVRILAGIGPPSGALSGFFQRPVGGRRPGPGLVRGPAGATRPRPSRLPSPPSDALFVRIPSWHRLVLCPIGRIFPLAFPPIWTFLSGLSASIGGPNPQNLSGTVRQAPHLLSGVLSAHDLRSSLHAGRNCCIFIRDCADLVNAS